MKAKCLQENIHRALQIASRVTPGRTLMPITQSTLIRAEGKMLQFVATNLEMTVKMSLPAEVTEEGALAVPNKLLADFISALPKETVEMEQPAGTTTMRLKCGTAKANINSADADLFPPTPVVENSASIPLSVEEFRKAVGRVAFCAASDNGRPVLTGVLMEVNGGELVTVGADGFRLGVQYTSLAETPETGARVVVPARALNEIQRIANNNGERVEIIIPQDAKHIRFRIGSEEPSDTDIEIVSMLMADAYPNYESLIPPQMENRAVFNLSDLQGAIRRAAIFARDDYNTIRFDIHKERRGTRAVISSESRELGNNRAELEAENPMGNDIDIAFNAKFIQEALSNLGSSKVQLETSKSAAPAKMTIPDKEDYIHIMMPIMTLEQAKNADAGNEPQEEDADGVTEEPEYGEPDNRE